MHPLRKQRLYIILSIVFGTSLAVYLVIKGLSESVDLFYSPSQLQNEGIAINQNVRVGGMVKSGSINKDKNILEIGCGAGRFTEYIAKYSKSMACTWDGRCHYQ